MRAVAVPKRGTLGGEGGVAQVLVAFIAGQVEVGQPGVAVAAAGGDEGHMAAIGRPGRGMIGGGMLRERNDLAALHVDHGDVEVVVLVGLKGEPLPIR